MAISFEVWGQPQQAAAVAHAIGAASTRRFLLAEPHLRTSYPLFPQLNVAPHAFH